MSLLIKDPRQFSEIYPDSNMLINQSLHDIKNNDSDALICALLEEMLKQQQDQTLSVGFSLAPNLAIANYIWDSLQKTINNPVSQKTYLFAFNDLGMIRNSKAGFLFISQFYQKTKMLNNSVNISAIKAVFDKHQVFSNDYVLCEKLFSLDALAKIKPSKLYQLAHQDYSNSELCLANVSLPILAKGEEVYLRYILGATLFNGDLPITNLHFNKCGMELMQIITDSVKRDDATTFPITFHPCQLSEATVIGEQYRQEIAITFKLSNEIKKQRLAGKIPFVKLYTKDTSIHIELFIKESQQLLANLEWRLHLVDSFEKVCQILEMLFEDMQLEVTYENQ